MERLIKDMVIGEFVYVSDWAIRQVNNSMLVYLKHSVYLAPDITATVRLLRMESGYYAFVLKPMPPTATNAVISFHFKKYPWTGATDDDVAPVTVIDVSVKENTND